jgi:hypothetical protein
MCDHSPELAIYVDVCVLLYTYMQKEKSLDQISKLEVRQGFMHQYYTKETTFF